MKQERVEAPLSLPEGMVVRSIADHEVSQSVRRRLGLHSRLAFWVVIPVKIEKEDLFVGDTIDGCPVVTVLTTFPVFYWNVGKGWGLTQEAAIEGFGQASGRWSNVTQVFFFSDGVKD